MDGPGNALLVHDKGRLTETRSALTKAGLYDTSRRISRLEEDSFALPITPAAIDQLLPARHDITDPSSPNPQPTTVYFNGTCHTLIHTDLPMSKKAIASAKGAHENLKTSIQQILSRIKPPLDEKCTGLLSEIPRSWERHGDLIVLSAQAFRSREWKEIILCSSDFWSTVAVALNCKRLARNAEVLPNEYRSSGAELLLGSDPWVEHIDNGIKYIFDITQVMFSSGNIVEKLRVSEFDCTGETVVDLYAGIGYFTLPYLVHTGVRCVHACEWNMRAVEGLEKGLATNGVKEKCIVHVGDCRKVCPRGIADRVNLGLLPTSESGWPTACAALKTETGGWLYIHGNVSCRPGGPFRVPKNPWENEGGMEGEGLRRGAVMEYRHINPVEVEEKTESESEGIGGNLVSSESHINSDLVQHKEDVSQLKIKENRSLKTPPLARFTNNPMTMSELRSIAKDNWKHYILQRIGPLLSEENPLCERWRWDVRVGRVGVVKSYAPFVDHLVADVECRPVPIPRTGTE